MGVAAIDIGTNTVLLLVAERTADGALRAVEERATIVRLGEGVDKTHRLSGAAVERTRKCLEEYAVAVARFDVERIAVVGTSAMRDAAGAEEVIAIVKNLFNVDAQIIGGDEEAQLTFRGALSGLSTSDADGRVAVFDVGGGSTEVVIGCLTERGPEIDFAESYDVGSVRLTERIVRSDPPSHAEIQEMSEYVRRVFERIPPLPVRTSIPIGIAGTVTTLMAVSMSLAEYDGSVVHGRLMSRDSLRHVVSDLASVDLNARRRRAGLAPGRADVIVAGGLVVLELLAHWGASEMRVSDRGVRWGLAEGLAK